MRRLAILAVLIAVPALGFRVVPPPGARIAVLRMSDEFTHGAEMTVARTVQNDLRDELRALGFDAIDAGITFDELARDGGPDADYYVEVISSHAINDAIAGGGAAAPHIGLDVAVVVSNVAAAVRLYEGRTLQRTASYDLRKKITTLLPTSIGLGGRFFWARVPLPFLRYAQYRSAAHAVAELAARRIAGQ